MHAALFFCLPTPIVIRSYPCMYPLQNKTMAEVDRHNLIYDFAAPEQQEARTFLRERFLRVVSGVIGKPARFHLHGNTKVEAEFRGFDVDCLEILTKNLVTPLGTVPDAILRSTDVISIEIDGIVAVK